MRARELAAAAAVVAILAGCGEEDFTTIQTTTTEMPWQGAHGTATGSGVPSVTPSVSTAAAGTPTATPSPTPEPEPSRTSTAKPVEPSPETAVGTLAGPAAEVVVLINAARADEGCVALRVDARLQAAAQAHSTDMAERNYLSHESPDGVGPGERIASFGYDDWSGENIAQGYSTAAAVVAAWLDSPSHRNNALDCNAVATGVGVADSSRGRYWTQTFGRS